MKHVRQILILGTVAAAAVGCGQDSGNEADEAQESGAEVTTSQLPASSSTETSLDEGVPGRDDPPVVMDVGGLPQPAWATDVAIPSDAVLDVFVSPFDSVSADETQHVEIRLFADADPEAVDELTSTLRDAGVAVEPTIYTCPYTAQGYSNVQAYLRSFEWSDDNGQRLDSPRFAPRPAESGRHGWGRCLILFPLEKLSASEVDNIRTFALGEGVNWINFWAGPVEEIYGDPLGLPRGGLPSIELPSPCDPSGCTGDEISGG